MLNADWNHFIPRLYNLCVTREGRSNPHYGLQSLRNLFHQYKTILCLCNVKAKRDESSNFCESMGVDETLVELAAKQQLESVPLKDLKSDKFKDADSNSLRAHMRAG